MNIEQYDKRQVSLMKDMLWLYSSEKISLKQLIDNLDGLLSCIGSIDIEWKEKFHEHWFVLEQVYAVSLFRNEVIDQNDLDIQESIEQLLKLLNE
ncbi:hypothetical protein VQ643_14985 [Pseudomonas sp. F1_0610]|uniref:hypothetical protein n=1 Tax=Pseudomonas sp. F1_0610 TaxID=3114284 RepID=UPI0039C061D3